MSISVQSLVKNYGEQKAVDHISFEVGKGEIVGFLGPNGAGKSTTMKILTGYLQSDGGKALVSGIDVRDNPFQAKKKIGYLPESNPLYYDMYVREYIDFITNGIHRHFVTKSRFGNGCCRACCIRPAFKVRPGKFFFRIIINSIIDCS